MEAIIDGSLCLYAGVILGLITIGYVSELKKPGPAQKCYAALLASGFLLMCCGTLSGIWQSKLSPGTLRFLQTMYIVLVYVIVILYSFYIRLLRMVVWVKSMEEDRPGLLICLAVSVLNILVWLIGLKSDRVFTALQQSIGKRWTEFWVVGMIVINVRFLLRNRSGLGKENAVLLSFLTTMPMIGWLLQLIWPEQLLLAPVTGLALVISYISIQRNQGILIGEMLAAKEKDRLRIVTAQLKPHFLYNCLTTIYMLCDEDAERAQQAVSVFSELLRGTLDSINSDETVPFSCEKKQIENYLYMEKLRFRQRFDVEYRIETESFSLPPLSVQSLVDNAVKHGIGKTKKHVDICISTEEQEDGFLICVQDDGEGFDPEKLEPLDASGNENREHSHMGLTIVRERVKLICGGTLTVSSKPGEGTKATIFLPRKQETDRAKSF